MLSQPHEHLRRKLQECWRNYVLPPVVLCPPLVPWHWVFSIPVHLSQAGMCSQPWNEGSAPCCAVMRDRRCSWGFTALDVGFSSAGRMISGLFWGSPEMQETRFTSLPHFFFSHCFHLNLGCGRTITEDAWNSPTLKAPASWISRVTLEFPLMKVT